MKSVIADNTAKSTKANALKRDSGFGRMFIKREVSEMFGVNYESGKEPYYLTEGASFSSFS